MRYISTSSITLTFFSGYYGFQAYSWEGSMLVQASRNLRNTLVHVHAWSWWLTCNLDNWVLCANKLLKSLQPLPDPIFFPLLILSPWICDHETDWWCHLWVFITWDSVQKTVLGFPLPQAFIINIPLFLLYQYILSSDSASNPGRAIWEIVGAAIRTGDTACLQ